MTSLSVNDRCNIYQNDDKMKAEESRSVSTSSSSLTAEPPCGAAIDQGRVQVRTEFHYYSDI